MGVIAPARAPMLPRMTAPSIRELPGSLCLPDNFFIFRRELP
jgi:hypothetical protein